MGVRPNRITVGKVGNGSDYNRSAAWQARAARRVVVAWDRADHSLTVVARKRVLDPVWWLAGALGPWLGVVGCYARTTPLRSWLGNVACWQGVPIGLEEGAGGAPAGPGRFSRREQQRVLAGGLPGGEGEGHDHVVVAGRLIGVRGDGVEVQEFFEKNGPIFEAFRGNKSAVIDE